MARRYIIGLGNFTRSDDAVGLKVVESIADNHLEVGFELVGLADSGTRLLDYFTPETEKIVLIDCAKIGLPPGECRIFGHDEVESTKILKGRSTHEGDILSVIELGRTLGMPVPKMAILGIEPESLENGTELSPKVAALLQTYADTAIAEVRR